MKHLLLVYSLVMAMSVAAQPAGKKCVLPLVKWTLTLPVGFVSFPARDTHIPIAAGHWDTGRYVPKRSLLTAMNGPNLLEVTIAGCDPAKSPDNAKWKKQIYDAEAAEKDVRVDSASTDVTIDGVVFTTIILVRRKNNLIEDKRVLMWTCYKGYALSVMYLSTNRHVGEQLNAMLRGSSFH